LLAACLLAVACPGKAAAPDCTQDDLMAYTPSQGKVRSREPLPVKEEQFWTRDVEEQFEVPCLLGEAKSSCKARAFRSCCHGHRTGEITQIDAYGICKMLDRS
jgi:hypothetical protein